MDEITDFAWDRMLLYQVMSSESEISTVLGVDFRGIVDMSSGMVFVKDNEIVYQKLF
jgi:hypothetical protein